jgi:glutamate-1-semialdehyde aminotransferase
MAQKVSSELNRRALRSMSGGVNSPVRAFKAVGAEPLPAIMGREHTWSCQPVSDRGYTKFRKERYKLRPFDCTRS